jgi:hypothetical protein
MQVNLSCDLLDLDGVSVGKPISSFAVDALMAPAKGDDLLSGSDKLNLFRIAQALHGASGSVELSAADVVVIKDRVAKAFPALVVGRIYAALGETS